MTVEETLSTMSPVIAFLATAETELRVGVIHHHDVKPSNILLDLNGMRALIDFGIAQTPPRDQARLRLGERRASPQKAAFLQVAKLTCAKAATRILSRQRCSRCSQAKTNRPRMAWSPRIADGSLRYDPRLDRRANASRANTGCAVSRVYRARRERHLPRGSCAQRFHARRRDARFPEGRYRRNPAIDVWHRRIRRRQPGRRRTPRSTHSMRSFARRSERAWRSTPHSVRPRS